MRKSGEKTGREIAVSVGGGRRIDVSARSFSPRSAWDRRTGGIPNLQRHPLPSLPLRRLPLSTQKVAPDRRAVRSREGHVRLNPALAEGGFAGRGVAEEGEFEGGGRGRGRERGREGGGRGHGKRREREGGTEGDRWECCKELGCTSARKQGSVEGMSEARWGGGSTEVDLIAWLQLSSQILSKAQKQHFATHNCKNDNKYPSLSFLCLLLPLPRSSKRNQLSLLDLLPSLPELPVRCRRERLQPRRQLVVWHLGERRGLVEPCRLQPLLLGSERLGVRRQRRGGCWRDRDL